MIKDSGNRREFPSGAVRDIDGGKGRCDLLPLDVVSEVLNDTIFKLVCKYTETGDKSQLVEAIKQFAERRYESLHTAMLEVSIHYKEGCAKYGERNWQKGIPLHCYIDSAVRHYIKWLRGDTDENHARAFIWNILGAIWTQDHCPDQIDLPYAKTV